MTKTITWRLHAASPPDTVYRMWSSDEGRERFWAEGSRSDGDTFSLALSMGVEGEFRVIAVDPPTAAGGNSIWTSELTKRGQE
jgi:uncharacterized protein YndB with AHSA1/START domain